MSLAKQRFTGLGARILLIFMLAFLPVAALTVYVVAQAGRRERALGFEQAHRWARIISANQQQLISQTRLALRLFGNADNARSANPACGELARQILASSPQYANIGMIELDGRVSCSALPAPNVNVADRAYFRRAIERREFAYGEFQIGRITGRPTLNFGWPVVDESGRVARVAFVALDLNWLSSWTQIASLPSGSTITLIDEAGIVLFRNEDPDRWIGRPFNAPVLWQAMQHADSGMAAAAGLDGVRRLYHFITIPDSAGIGKMRVLAGITESQALWLTYRVRERATLVLVLALVATLVVGWFLADRLILRRIFSLEGATRRLAAGDLSTRIGAVPGNDELTGLASSFDRMAQSLETSYNRIQQDEANDRFLAEASRILGTSLDYRKTLQSVAELSVAKFADWCVVDVRGVNGDGRELRLVHHEDPSKEWLAAELAERYPEDPHDESRPTNQVLRTGEPILIRKVTPEMLAASARDAEHARVLKELGLCSAIIVPLRHANDSLGVLTLISAESETEFDEKDVRVAQELGRRAAIAVENARLFTDVQVLNAQLEDRVRARTAELEAVNRELEAFSYSVSHDLRSPLRSLDGFSQALAEDYADVLDEQGKDFLRRIRAAAQRMGRLIDDLLSLARVSRLDMKLGPVDLTALAESVFAELKRTDPDRRVTVAVSRELTTTGDVGLLRVVLENLLGNAWKFTGRAHDARIEFGEEEKDGQRVFFVRDNGAGFDMAYASKLFGPFQRLHAMTEFPGTGVGLATVQRIIARHGGRIWVEAAVNQGATFYFTLEEDHERHNPAG